jgi:multicomponent Na+:H+ antiporter subunit F
MIVIDIAVGLVVVTILAAVYRIAKGPSDADRAVAADLMFFGIIALIALLGVRLASAATFDILLIATLVGFLGIMSLSRALTRGKR